LGEAQEPVRRPDILANAVANYQRSARLMREFAALRHTERREFDDTGRQTSLERWVQKIDFVDGVRVGWTIERDGKPLSGEEKARTEAAVRKAATEWKSKSPAEREEALRKAEKETGYLNEFPHALVFAPLPEETLNGRPALVWSFKPKPGYKPKSMGGRVFEGVTGRIWLDRDELQLARLEAEVFKDVTVGGFLAKVEKGTRFELAQAKVEPGCWLPVRQSIRYGARILLVKNIHRSVDTRYSEWRRGAAATKPGD
jgi:hypothetical protein